MKLLAAIDLHDNPESMVDEATRWAERTGGTLSLLFVEELGEAWATGVSDPTVLSLLEVERASLRKVHRDRIAELTERIPADFRGAPLVKDGVAWRAIADASEQTDLLLIGTHGRTGFAHFFLGSVAERVVRAAHCPVLVLRPSGSAGRATAQEA